MKSYCSLFCIVLLNFRKFSFLFWSGLESKCKSYKRFKKSEKNKKKEEIKKGEVGRAASPAQPARPTLTNRIGTLSHFLPPYDRWSPHVGCVPNFRPPSPQLPTFPTLFPPRPRAQRLPHLHPILPTVLSPFPLNLLAKRCHQADESYRRNPLYCRRDYVESGAL
jgi:hypothetical protein